MNLKEGTLLEHIAPLFAAARDCERMSCKVSRRQAALARSAPLAQALAAQSRQEAMHAAVFEAALAFAPRSIAPPRLAASIAEYGRRLDADLDSGALAASLLGLQCVFEGLAAVALDPPEGELTRLGKRLMPLLTLVRRQETAHRRLGEAALARLARVSANAEAGEATRAPLPDDSATEEALLPAWRAYIDHAEAMTDAALAAFGGTPADFEHYRAHTRSCLDALRRGAPWRVAAFDGANRVVPEPSADA